MNHIKGASLLNIGMVNKILNDLITSAKSDNKLMLEDSVNWLIQGLKSRNVPYIETEKDYILTFSGFAIKEWFHKTNSYTFQELIETFNKIAFPLLETKLLVIYNLLNKIYKSYDGKSSNPSTNI